jgi:acyl carrier protein
VLYTLDSDYAVELRWSDDARLVDAWFVRRSLGRRPPAPQPRKFQADLQRYAHRATPTAHSGALAERLGEYARAHLPDFMVPSTFVVRSELPLTPNGKLDRKALPAPEAPAASPARPFTPPSNEDERAIAAVWQELLRVEQVDLHDNFFDLGANSLMMMQANGRLRTALNKPISLVDMFQFPTVASLAAYLAGSERAKAPATVSGGLDRAHTRREAMQRRRDAASGRDPKR